MKKFIDNEGLFEIKVPSNWVYSLNAEKVHTFTECESSPFEIFQISFMDFYKKDKKYNFEKPNEITIGKYSCYCSPDIEDEESIFKSWMSCIDSKLVYFTLTISKNINEILLSQKMNAVHNVIAEFKFIEENERVSKVNSYRFLMFIKGVSASALILRKAVRTGSFIEATCLIANQIDALLRTGIVLKIQIIEKNSEIDDEWIFQGHKDKKKAEKEIYKKSKELGIIDENIFKELYSFYEERNKIVHRFIISEITVAEIERIAHNYYSLLKRINEIIFDIESEQIKLNVGMTKLSSKNSDDMNELISFVQGKICKIDYFEEKDLVKNG